MNADGAEIILLGYSASESESIRRVLSPLTHEHGLSLRNVHELAQLPALLGASRLIAVVANDWYGGIDVNRVIEICKQRSHRLPVVFVSNHAYEEIACHIVECGADDYVFWDRLYRLRWIILRHLRARRHSLPRLVPRCAPPMQIGERLSSLLDISTDAVIAADRHFNVVFFNKGAERIFGHAADEIVGQPMATLVPSFAVEVGRYSSVRIDNDGASGIGECGEVIAYRKDGSEFSAEMSLAVLDEEGGAVCLAILRDISEKQRVAQQVEYLATHDSLTGLPNRRLFFDRLTHAIAFAERAEKLMALMFIDLDGFKQINDTLGHAAGDELLRVVAQRLRGRLRAADTVARLGGDEFAVILEQLNHVDPISEIAAALLRTLGKPITIAGETAVVSASIGIVICPLEAKSCKEMMVDADRAMYAAKSAGKNRFLFYSVDMSGVCAAVGDAGQAPAAERRAEVRSLAEHCA